MILHPTDLHALWVQRINHRAYNAIEVARSLGLPLAEAIDRCLLVRALAHVPEDTMLLGSPTRSWRPAIMAGIGAVP